MGKKPLDDCYALLGLEAGADSAELRRAWRRLALRWHPDRAGPSATATFQKIAAAYALLSDPAARAAYDEERGTAARGSASSKPARNGARSGPAARSSSERPREPGQPPSSATRRRAPGVMLSRLTGHLRMLLASGVARRGKDGVIELTLNAQESAQGGMASVSMDVPVRCPACVGKNAASCGECGGNGWVEQLYSAWLAIPPGVAEGTVLVPSAQLPGVLRPVTFRVRHRPAR